MNLDALFGSDVKNRMISQFRHREHPRHRPVHRPARRPARRPTHPARRPARRPPLKLPAGCGATGHVLKQDVRTLMVFGIYSKCLIWGVIGDQEGCRNRVGTRVSWLYVLKQDVRTLMFLVYLFKMLNLGYDMGSRGMSEPHRNARVLARFA